MSKIFKVLWGVGALASRPPSIYNLNARQLAGFLFHRSWVCFRNKSGGLYPGCFRSISN